jgi:UMF1 family MFS transporter
MSGQPSKEYRRQLWGWLSYAFASEVFVIVSLTLFLPICLEQFARDNGFLLPDKTKPCSSNPAPPVTTTEEDEIRCVVKLGWAWVDTASFRCVLRLVSSFSSVRLARNRSRVSRRSLMAYVASTRIPFPLRCKL